MSTSARTTVAALLLPLGLASLAACGTDDPAPVAADPADGNSQGPALPTEVPGADGQVTSRYLPTVMDTGDGPELCLGAIAESYPPQCSGPAISGWDWPAQKPNFDQQGDVRWGTFAVTGTWDGTTFTVTDAVPGALYDPAQPEPQVLPTPSVEHDQAELDAIAAELQEDLPGVQSSATDEEGHVLVDVTYDDGTIQDYVDAEYGAGVVVVSGALVDVEQ